MNSLNGMWTISRSGENFNEYEYFETKIEAVQFGLNYEDFEGKSFYVGQIESIPMHTELLANLCIDYISEHHAENDGEWGTEYLDDVKKEHLLELDEAIKNVVLKWATKHDYHPKHFNVINIDFIETGVY